MRIKRISAQGITPVGTFIADDLKDLVVIVGSNGVGKTRLVKGLLNYFQTARPNRRGTHLTNPSFVIEATDRSEQDAWDTRPSIPNFLRTRQSCRLRFNKIDKEGISKVTYYIMRVTAPFNRFSPLHSNLIFRIRGKNLCLGIWR